MIINFTLGGNGGASDPSKLDVTVFNEYTETQSTIDESQNTAIDDIETDITGIKSKIEDIELFKFPNATIIGEPTIQNGQVSDFSTVSYLQFPFIVDLHNKAFEINFCFTTATNVQTQQNILDSKFGLALAIKDGKGLMAISSDGQSWNIGNTTGTMNIESNTTYYAKLTWNGIQYKTALSTNGEDYTEDMVLVGAQAPHPTTIFIGGCDTLATGHEPHPFLGTINLNNANLIVSGNVIWSGMDDAGLATRMATDMSNIDEAGVGKVKEIISEEKAYFAYETKASRFNIYLNKDGANLSNWNVLDDTWTYVIDWIDSNGNMTKDYMTGQCNTVSGSTLGVNYVKENNYIKSVQFRCTLKHGSKILVRDVYSPAVAFAPATFNMSVEFEDGTTGNYVVVQKV